MKRICKVLSIVLIIAFFIPVILTQATTNNKNTGPADAPSPLVITAPLLEDIPKNPDCLFGINSVPQQNNARSTPSSFDVNGFHYDFATYVKTQGQQNVAAFTATTNFTSSEIISAISTFQQSFPNAELIGNPTSAYNCHSYAWYSSSTSNPYWISDIELYINDAHTYMLTEADTVQIGDIMVYFNEYGIQHSAVITDASSNNYICVSKWGASVLCEHRYDYVPTTYAKSDGSIWCHIYRIMPHSWTSYTSHQTGTHTRYCGTCKKFESEKCNLTYVSNGSSGHYQSCSLCGYRSATTSCTTVTKYTGSGSDHTHGQVCSQCNHQYTTAQCNPTYAYHSTVSGQNYHYKRCGTCGHVTESPTKCLYKGSNTTCLTCGWQKGATAGSPLSTGGTAPDNIA